MSEAATTSTWPLGIPDAAEPLPTPTGVPHLVAELGGHLIGLPLAALLEVVELGAVTPLPATPSWLLGVANLRGMVVPVVHLAALLGWEVGRPGRRALLLRDGQARLAVPVDGVLAVHWLELPPAAESAGDELTCELTLDDRPLRAVRPEAVLTQVRRGHEAALAGR